MTDKEIFGKLEAEIERLENYENESVTSSDTRFGWIHGKTFALTSIRVLLDSMQEEPKECMYSKDNYTDEDRKILCEDCEEECKFNKKEEIKSVHAQHTTISSPLNDYLCKAYSALYKENGGILSFARLQNMAIDITEWQKQQMMAKAVDATVHIDAGGYPYIPQMELYDYDKDIPLAKKGDKYKVILIKED